MPAKTPEEVGAIFEKGINAGDAAAVAALYEPNATVVALARQPVTGSAAILQALTGIVGEKPKIKQNVVSVVTAGDIAVLYNDWTGSMSGFDGSETQMTGKAMKSSVSSPTAPGSSPSTTPGHAALNGRPAIDSPLTLPRGPGSQASRQADPLR